MINVTQLQPAHIVSTDTRQRIHELTDTPSGPTMAVRDAFAKKHGVRNVTKYWPVDVVLKACDEWGIQPVLGKGGRQFVKNSDGLAFKGKANNAKPITGERQEGMASDPFAKPPVFFGAPATPVKQIVTPTDGGTTAASPDSDRERKLAALRDLVKREVEAARGEDDEALKTLIAGVSEASVNAVLDTKGKQLLARLEEANEARVQAVLDKIDEARPVVHLIHNQATGEESRVDGMVHAAFTRVLLLCQQRKNIALIGPTGCGKTHLHAQVAKAMSLDHATQSCTMGMSEVKLVGGLLPIGEGGRFEAYISDFVRLFRDGGIFLLDEYDSIDPNVALILNQALANGYIDLPLLGRINRHKDFICIAAMNTYGTGADRQYVGRSQLDEASLDRFRIGQVEMDYDQKLEETLVGPKHQTWAKRAWHVRAAIRANRLRRNMSTRFMLDGRDMLEAGDTVEKVLTAFALDWSPDDRAKVGITPVPLF